jgi:MFS family permease
MGPLSDRFGRKPVGCATFTLTLLCISASTLANSAKILLAARFLICFFIGGAYVLATLAKEIIPAECRMHMHTFCNWVGEKYF